MRVKVSLKDVGEIIAESLRIIKRGKMDDERLKDMSHVFLSTDDLMRAILPCLLKRFWDELDLKDLERKLCKVEVCFVQATDPEGNDMDGMLITVPELADADDFDEVSPGEMVN